MIHDICTECLAKDAEIERLRAEVERLAVLAADYREVVRAWERIVNPLIEVSR